MSEKKNTVFFDIKNVLLYFDAAKMRSQIAKYCEIEEDLVGEILDKRGLGIMYEKGQIDSRALFHSLPSHVQGTGGFQGFFEAISSVFDPNNTINPLLKELKKNHVKLFICSNICEAHFNYAYTHYSTFHLFDGFILSYEVKSEKPEDLIYSSAILKTATTKENTLFIEGRPEYAEKARSLGLDSEYYTTTQCLKEHLKQRGLLPE